MDQLIGKPFPLLLDPKRAVIRPYEMTHDMGGGDVVANMGYVIVDARGIVRANVVDPLFGQHADTIVQTLKAVQ